MKSERLFTILAIMVGILTPISVLYIDRSETFGAFPIFDVNVELNQLDKNDVQVFFTNIGGSQGHDVIIYVEPNDVVELGDWVCLEGLFHIEDSYKIFKISFKKMSNNVPCSILFHNAIDGNLANITITADDVSGQKFSVSRYADQVNVYNSDFSSPGNFFNTSIFYIMFVEFMLILILVSIRIIYNRRIRNEYKLNIMNFLETIHTLKQEYFFYKK